MQYFRSIFLFDNCQFDAFILKTMHHELNLFSFVTFSGDNTDEMTQKKRKTDHSDSMEAFPKKTTFLPQSKGMILYSFASLWFRVFYLLNDTVLCLYFPILVQMFECVILGYEGAKRKNSLTHPPPPLPPREVKQEMSR